MIRLSLRYSLAHIHFMTAITDVLGYMYMHVGWFRAAGFVVDVSVAISAKMGQQYPMLAVQGH